MVHILIKQKYRNNTSICPRIQGTMCVVKGENKKRPACRERGKKGRAKIIFHCFQFSFVEDQGMLVDFLGRLHFRFSH
jgi:hypothetical protein